MWDECPASSVNNWDQKAFKYVRASINKIMRDTLPYAPKIQHKGTSSLMFPLILSRCILYAGSHNTKSCKRCHRWETGWSFLATNYYQHQNHLSMMMVMIVMVMLMLIIILISRIIMFGDHNIRWWSYPSPCMVAFRSRLLKRWLQNLPLDGGKSAAVNRSGTE